MALVLARVTPNSSCQTQERSLKLATTKFVPLCRGIEGTVGSLEVNENYVPEPVDVPIDTLLIDFNNQQSDDVDIAGNDEAGEILFEFLPMRSL